MQKAPYSSGPLIDHQGFDGIWMDHFDVMNLTLNPPSFPELGQNSAEGLHSHAQIACDVRTRNIGYGRGHRPTGPASRTSGDWGKADMECPLGTCADRRVRCHARASALKVHGGCLLARPTYYSLGNTFVAVSSRRGGVEKVWNGAGDGTSHSRPCAPSQGH